MYVTTNSMLVWKRQADENQQSAKKLARVSVGLAVILLAVAAYAISAQARYSSLCSAIEDKSRQTQLKQDREFAEGLAASFCN